MCIGARCCKLADFVCGKGGGYFCIWWMKNDVGCIGTDLG